MRVEQIGKATLYLGDCAEVMPTLDKADALIADPPYGISYSRDSKSSYKLDAFWGEGARRDLGGKDPAPLIGDDRPFDPSPLLSRARKLILWGASAYADKLPANYGWLIWDKQIVGNWSGGHAEMAWTNFLGSSRIHRQRWQGIVRAGEECPYVGGRLVHPTQKPVALMRFCIEQAKRPQTIVDPYMGSGSLGVAAVEMECCYVGIEIHEPYFEIACERVENAQRQRSLIA